MDYRLTDEQELFVKGVRDLMERENWEQYFSECDENSQYPERFVKELAEMGIDSLLLPEEFGGFEAGLMTLAVIWEELGRSVPPPMFCSNWPALPQY